MQSVGIYEAKTRFSALIELVEQGEEVRITRHGKEVVRLLPVRLRWRGAAGAAVEGWPAHPCHL